MDYGYLIVDDVFFQPTECQERTKQIVIPRSVYEKIINNTCGDN